MSNLPQAHARFSPSGASKWMRCPGSLALELGLPNNGSSFADEGTAAHELAAWVLQNNIDSAWHYEGAAIRVVNGKVKPPGDRLKLKDPVYRDFTYKVDQAMIEHIDDYVGNVRVYANLPGAVLLTEMRVDFSDVIGVPNSFGTSDNIIITPEELIVVDLKYGMGVEVSAERNEQLMTYARAAYDIALLWYGTIKQVRLVIHQPRIENLSEWTCSVEELLRFGDELKEAAAIAQGMIEKKNAGQPIVLADLNPGDKQCRWCQALAFCPAAQAKVSQEVIGDFEDMENNTVEEACAAYELALETTQYHAPERLAKALACVGYVERWGKAVREAAMSRLISGEAVPGYKLVEGKKGRRGWSNTEEVAEMLKDFDKAFTRAVKSPAQLEKIYKGDGLWDELKIYIKQSHGKPSIAPADDPRAEIKPGEDIAFDFEDMAEQE